VVIELTEKFNLGVAEHDELLAENVLLKARLAEYEHRLKKTSLMVKSALLVATVATPRPAMVWPNPRLGSSRPKVPARQVVTGHKGQTVSRSNTIDHFLGHRPTSCSQCGRALAAVKWGSLLTAEDIAAMKARYGRYLNEGTTTITNLNPCFKRDCESITNRN